MGVQQAVVRAFNSYRRGLARRPADAGCLPARDFAMLYLSGSIGTVPVRERRLLRELKSYCFAGLELARQGRVEPAEELYERARPVLARLREGSEVNHLLGISAYQSSIAYWFSKRGEWRAAEERLLLAMDADCELEQLGFPVMQLHRVQQGHNLVRLRLYRRRRPDAVELAAHLYNYVEGRETALPYHRDWRPETIRAVPDDLARSILLSLLSELASFLCTGSDREEEWALFFRHARLGGEAPAALFPQARDYLLARRALGAADDEAYLGELDRFFRGGIRDCPGLWYAALVDFRDWCSEKPWDVARKVRALLTGDAAKWRGVPPHLAALFRDEPAPANRPA